MLPLTMLYLQLALLFPVARPFSTMSAPSDVPLLLLGVPL